MAELWRTALEYRVPYADTDQMQVVYYANYLVLFERARNELIRLCGITYRELEHIFRGQGLPIGACAFQSLPAVARPLPPLLIPPEMEPREPPSGAFGEAQSESR